MALIDGEGRAKTQSSAAGAPQPSLARPAPRGGLTSEEARAKADQEDAELMGRFKKGDAKAFEQLLARHKKGVFNFCLKMLVDRAQAEDAMQEVFLRIVRSAKDWERQAKFTTWLYTIARNHCIDAIRKAGYRKTASLDHALKEGEEEGVPLSERVRDEEGIAPDRGAQSSRMRAVLAAALADLPPEQREVFVMREHAGMAFKDISAIVGVAENTVKSRMRYALEHLRQSLKKAGITREGTY